MSEKGLINPQVAYRPGMRGLLRLRLRHFGRRITAWRREWLQLFRKPVGVIGIAIILFFGLLALLQPLLMATVWEADIYDPVLGYDAEVFPHPSKPSLRHPLGTDGAGRDVLSRLAVASRTSFGVGIVAAVVGTLIGTTVGTAAAFYGGRVDSVLMTLSDAFILLPPAIVLLVIGFLFELSWLYVGLLFGVFAGLGSFALIMKSHASSVKSSSYVESGRVSGGGNWRILRVHVLPNLVAVIIVNMMFIATGAVMIEALLSYLGRTEFRLSWGSMIWTAQDDISSFSYGENLHVLIPPALAIMLFCSAFYLVGRSLEEVINPRLRSR